jgi:hypothetical protein
MLCYTVTRRRETCGMQDIITIADDQEMMSRERPRGKGQNASVNAQLSLIPVEFILPGLALFACSAVISWLPEALLLEKGRYVHGGRSGKGTRVQRREEKRR